MAIGDLIPIVLPTVVIVAAAAWVTVRDRSGHVAVDLGDDPVVRLVPVELPSRRVGPVRGALVEPRGESLGARLRSLAEPSPAEQPRRTAPRTARVSRRRTPLVAVGRIAPH